MDDKYEVEGAFALIPANIYVKMKTDWQRAITRSCSIHELVSAWE